MREMRLLRYCIIGHICPTLLIILLRRHGYRTIIVENGRSELCCRMSLYVQSNVQILKLGPQLRNCQLRGQESQVIAWPGVYSVVFEIGPHNLQVAYCVHIDLLTNTGKMACTVAHMTKGPRHHKPARPRCLRARSQWPTSPSSRRSASSRRTRVRPSFGASRKRSVA